MGNAANLNHINLGDNMKKSLAIALFLSASVNAYAVDGGAVIGGALGGATGAAVGYNVGGKNGGILGAAIGGATGAAIGSQQNTTVAAAPAPVQNVSGDDEEDNRHHRDNGRHLGQKKEKHERHRHED